MTPGHTWAAPDHIDFKFNLTGVKTFLDKFVRLSSENPEEVGYADMWCGHRDCGFELWCSPIPQFVFTITTYPQSGLTFADVQTLVEGEMDVADHGQGTVMVTFRTPAGIPASILRLAGACACTEERMLANFWWT